LVRQKFTDASPSSVCLVHRASLINLAYDYHHNEGKSLCRASLWTEQREGMEPWRVVLHINEEMKSAEDAFEDATEDADGEEKAED
jgi:hypothetical protein